MGLAANPSFLEKSERPVRRKSGGFFHSVPSRAELVSSSEVLNINRGQNSEGPSRERREREALNNVVYPRWLMKVQVARVSCNARLRQIHGLGRRPRCSL